MLNAGFKKGDKNFQQLGRGEGGKRAAREGRLQPVVTIQDNNVATFTKCLLLCFILPRGVADCLQMFFHTNTNKISDAVARVNLRACTHVRVHSTT